ncbi:MAG: thymidine kinase [Candidatus Magasanikbacteria bacterium]|nr:thymidine kinase [Candidatus Magasanikbacteria bacterium]MBT4350346.1 thymidine kinase [Candidatus Magasanikbacteria bacterium]MBT4542193.1 thymidine kinase [Candidatus Magasanikbacteria bacterium]MBT6252794.1 thymidine kinase [Candidatus Magasanikbacteria bacterium]MBT7755182.1 thymidine kinase [Candidatus Magasanikbacteria bacterium]
MVPYRQPKEGGWIEMICGGMFSGKTEELIRRLRRAVIGRQVVRCFKPKIDNRYADDKVVTHIGESLECIKVEKATDIVRHIDDTVTVIGIDEVQFFDAKIVEVTESFATKGIRVICAGLDQDYLGKPFEPVPQMMAIAEYVTKTHAVCVMCGGTASKSKRTSTKDTQVVVGEKDEYQARCRACYNK